MAERKINKAGDFRGGVNSPGSFTSDNEQQKKAQQNSQTGEAKDKASATAAITKSPVIKSNGKQKRITKEVQQYIRDELTKADSKGNTFLLSFVKKFLSEAKKDPNSKAGIMLANSMFNDKLFTTLDEDLINEENKDTDFKLYKIRQTLYDLQKDVYDNMIDNNFLIINSRRTGKCWAPDTLIRMWDGSTKKVQDIKDGDVILGSRSEPQTVVSTTSGIDDMFMVEAVKKSSGISFKCNRPHILTLKYNTQRAYKGYEKGHVYDIPLSEFITWSKTKQSCFSLFKARAEYGEREHFISPYFLGLWLGDGSHTSPSITVDSREVEELYEIDNYAASIGATTSVYHNKRRPNVLTVRVKAGDKLTNELKRLGIYGNKRIPKEYKIDSTKNRLLLLAGLIDSDGYNTGDGTYEFFNSNPLLLRDVKELADSLGYRTCTRYKKITKSWTLTIKGNLTEVPCVVPRKKQKRDCKQTPEYRFTVRAVGKGKYYGFTLSGDGRCLLDNYVVTHNTELAGRIIVRDLLRPIYLPNGIRVQNRVAYMNRSSSAAISQIEKPLMDALAASGLRCVKGSVAGQEMEFENGAKLLIVGNNNAGDLNRMRGFKFNTLIMDECSHQRNVRQLMQEVVEPTLADYGKEARLYLIGTPPRASGTFVEEIYNNALKRGWKLYHWTFIDNPFIMDRDTLIERVCTKYGVEPDSAFVRREYYGEMGVFDTDAMIFRGYKTHNITEDDINDKVWDKCYIGVDWGFEDKAAVVVGLVEGKKMYVVYDWAQSKCATSDTMKKVKEVYEKCKTLHVKRAPMVICDTNPKENVYELSKTHHVPAYSAYKYDKDMAIDQLAAWMRTAVISLSSKDTNLKEEAEKTLWKRDKETDKILHEIDDDFFHPNGMMALLYISRQFDNDVLLTGHSKGAKDILESVPRDKTYYEQEMEADGWEAL